ncbi:MAG: hypothetical protein [Bacteriophage sp.]|nr:MAG: hypothetical protein [Bacteriophage sp.]
MFFAKNLIEQLHLVRNIIVFYG